MPEADGKLRFWRGTDIAQLTPGQTATLGPNTLGYEWDEDIDNGARPPGLVRLSSATVDVPQRLQDFGSTYGAGTATHHLTLYRHSSGARVFATGAVQWSWGLDDVHDRGNDPVDVRMQQATVNILADLAAQPTTLQAGLAAASASTDVTPPTTTITSPLNGASVGGADHRDRYGERRRRPGRRGRGLRRRRRDLAPRDRARDLELHLHSRGARHGLDPRPRGRRQREPRGAGRGHHRDGRCAGVPVLALEQPSGPDQPQRERPGARSSSA